MPLVTRSGANATLHVGSVQPTMNQGDLWFDTANKILFYAEDDTPTLRQIEQTSNKDAANGYAGLDATTKIITTQIPTQFTNYSYFTQWHTAGLGTYTATNFYYLNSSAHAAGTSESSRQMLIEKQWTLRRITANVVSNSQSGTSETVTIRDDGANTSLLTISAGLTGFFDSGALSDVIAAGSKVCWNRDQTNVNTGSSVINTMAEIEA